MATPTGRPNGRAYLLEGGAGPLFQRSVELEDGVSFHRPPRALVCLGWEGKGPLMEQVLCEFCRSARAVAVFRQRDLLHGVTSDQFTVVRCELCAFLYLN